MQREYLTEGELGFRGLNSRDNPAILTKGYLSKSVNFRLDRGAATTRKGLKKFSESELYGSDKQVVGTGIYLDQNGQEMLILLVHNSTSNVTKLYTFNPDAPENQSGFSSGTTLTTPIPSQEGVEIIHAVDRVFISRGNDLRPLVWDMVSTPTEIPTNKEFPNCTGMLFYQNRIIATGHHLQMDPVRKRDTVCVSHFLQYDKWALADAFTVNQGGNDEVVAVVPWTMNEFLILCRNSTFYLNVGSNRYVSGQALSSDARLESLSVDVGCIAKKSAVQVGGGVFFLSDNGVYNLQPTQSGVPDGVKLLSLGDPVSAPIDDVIQRINKVSAAKSVATYWDNRYYLAVPLDSEEIVIKQDSTEIDEGQTQDTSDIPIPSLTEAAAEADVLGYIQCPVKDASLWSDGNEKLYEKATFYYSYPDGAGTWTSVVTKVVVVGEGPARVYAYEESGVYNTGLTSPLTGSSAFLGNTLSATPGVQISADFGDIPSSGSLVWGNYVPEDVGAGTPSYWNVSTYIPYEFIKNKATLKVGDFLYISKLSFKSSDSVVRQVSGSYEIIGLKNVLGKNNEFRGYIVNLKVTSVDALANSVDVAKEIKIRKVSYKNNAVLVYNFILREWESVDIYPDEVDVLAFLVAKRERRRRLFLIDSNEGILLTEENEVDEIGASEGTPKLVTAPSTGPYVGLTGAYVPFRLTESGYSNVPIYAELVTRSFTGGDGIAKRYSSIESDMSLPAGSIVETYSVTTNPDTETKIDSFTSAVSEDVTRRNPVRKTGFGLQIKFVSSNLQPTIRSNFVKFTINKKNNRNSL